MSDEMTVRLQSDPRARIGVALAGDVLEIGPGHDPFPTAPGAAVRYADKPLDGGRDANYPELVGVPHGPSADYEIDIDRDGLKGVADDSLDAVIACHMLEHVCNPLGALVEIDRVLRPGGRAVIVLPDRGLTFDRPRTSRQYSWLDYKRVARCAEIDESEIREFCAAIYYAQPIHPEPVREWHNPAKLDAAMLALHRRRSIHVHCWSPEEFASALVSAILQGLFAWELESIYFATPLRFNEFGLVLRKGGAVEAGYRISDAARFASDWIGMVRAQATDPLRIARFACALMCDLPDVSRETIMATFAIAAGNGAAG